MLKLGFSRLNAPVSARGLPALPALSRGATIPKIIHQTNSARPWPSIVERSVAQTRAMNPDWEYRFYDHDARRGYIEEHYGRDVLALYDRISPAYAAAQADLFRYLALYREGGIYLDIKSGTARPLSNTIDARSQYVLSYWPNGRGDQYDQWGIHSELTPIGAQALQQWHVISAPGHPFLRNVILAVMRNILDYNPAWHGTGRNAVFAVTGPVAYTLAILPLLEREPHELKPADDLGLYYSAFDQEGMGNEGHAGSSHYSQLAGQPVVLMNPVRMLPYRMMRRWGRIKSLMA
jgi:hypothetical protein